MNSKFFALALVFSLTVPASLRAEEDEYAPYLNPPSREERPAPLLTNEPVLGRVFGVQGSGADIQHYVFDLTNRTPRHAAIRSALAPGWGQAFNNEKGKGLLFFITTTGAFIGSVWRYRAAQESYDDYKARGLKDGPLYDDYEDKRLQAVLLGGTALLLYTFGIIDAYNRAYKPLYSTDRSLDLVFSSTEGRVTWSQKF